MIRDMNLNKKENLVFSKGTKLDSVTLNDREVVVCNDRGIWSILSCFATITVLEKYTNSYFPLSKNLPYLKKSIFSDFSSNGYL